MYAKPPWAARSMQARGEAQDSSPEKMLWYTDTWGQAGYWLQMQLLI